MAFLEKLCGSVLLYVILVTGASAGEPGSGAAKDFRPGGGGEPKAHLQRSPLPSMFVRGEGATFNAAVPSDSSAVKGGEPMGALPSRLVSGATARCDLSTAGQPVAKVRDNAGSLPTTVGSGDASHYAERSGAEPSASKSVESVGPAGVSRP